MLAREQKEQNSAEAKNVDTFVGGTTQLLGPRTPAPGEIVQPLAADALHHVEEAAVRQCANVVHGYDSRMLERSEDARLTQNSHTLIVGRNGRTEHLKCDVSIQLAVMSGVHGAHSAFADLLTDLVAGI